jgi:hypothetical protein
MNFYFDHEDIFTNSPCEKSRYCSPP